LILANIEEQPNFSCLYRQKYFLIHIQLYGMVFYRNKRNYRRGGYRGNKYRRMGKSGAPKPRVKARATLTNIIETVVRRNSELKYYDVNNGFTFPIAGSWAADLLSDIAQGQTDQTRVGDRLNLASLHLKYVIYDPSTTLALTGMNTVRVMVVQWFPMVSSQPPLTNILANSADVNSSLVHDNRQMFEMLYDKVHPIVATRDSAEQHHSYYCRFPRKRSQLQFSAGSAFSTNGIYFYAIASQQGATVTTAMTIVNRLTFYDS